MTITEDLRTQLRALRTERGLTQQQLADMAGLSRDAVARIEGGSRGGRVSTLCAMAKAMGARVVSRIEAIDVDETSAQVID